MGILKFLGILLALAAVYLASIKKREGLKIKASNFIFPLLVFLGSGIIDKTVKYLEGEYVGENDIPIFSATIYAMAAIIGTVILAIHGFQGKFKFQIQNVFGGIALGIPNYFSIYFLVLALRSGIFESSGDIYHQQCFRSNDFGLAGNFVVQGKNIGQELDRGCLGCSWDFIDYDGKNGDFYPKKNHRLKINLEPEKDTYKTILKPSEEVLFKEKGSKFFGYAFPVLTEEEVKEHIENLKKQHHSARHWCYAWQLGKSYEHFRANDDGEPSNSAGMPIYGQLQSFDLTNTLVVVVRYFGGTKLGVGGLVQAYKTTAQMALETSRIIEKTIDEIFLLNFEYPEMNTVMRIIKDENLSVISQKMELDCEFEISVRKKEARRIFKLFENTYKVEIKPLVEEENGENIS